MYLIHVETGHAVRIAPGVQIGRGETCGLVLGDRSVSRLHAVVQRDGTGWRLVDQGSRSGVFVGGQRVPHVPLHPGVMIVLGRAHLLVSVGKQGFTTRDEQTTIAPLSELSFRSAAQIQDARTLRQDYEQLRAVYELTRSLDVEQGVDKTLDRILRTSFRLLSADRGVIHLFVQSGMERQHALSARPGEPKLAIPHALLEELVNRRCGLIAPETQDLPKDADKPPQRRCVMCVPLLYRDEVLGVIGLDRPAEAHAFSNHDLTLFSTIASHAALVIKDRSLRDQLLAAEVTSKTRLEQIIGSMPCGVLLLDAQLSAQAMNQRMRDILQELGFDSIGALLGDPEFRVALDTQREFTRAQAPERCYSVQASSALSGEQLIVLQDVSELRAQQRREAHQARLALVGQVAGGIAHDFNSLLTVVINGAEQLQELSDDPDLLAESEAVLEAGKRASHLVQQLLTFSRRDEVRRALFSLDARVRISADLVARTLPDGVQLQIDLQANTARVWMDPGHLDRIVMNLINNAHDAIASAGTIQLKTSVVNISAPDAWSDSSCDPDHLSPGGYVCLAVIDDGPGMSDLVRRRVFEPFFSTKEAGRGTGLGLATVLGIVRRHEGRVQLKSELGTGTTVSVLLPLATQPRPGSRAAEGAS